MPRKTRLPIWNFRVCSVLGFLCSTPILFSFFTHFVFFTYVRAVPGEWFWKNVEQAGRAGFLTQMALSTGVIACDVVGQDWGMQNAASFPITGLTLFLSIFSYREYKEKRGPVEG